MRTVFMVVIAFVAGFATATFTGSLEGQSSAANSQQTATQSVAPSPPTQMSYGRQEVLRLGRNGHATARIEVNGNRMEALVDTGASAVVLRESEARRAGYRLRASDFTVTVSTANGQTFAAPIVLREIELGSIRVRNVHALVSPDDALSTNLLGMSFLGQLEAMRIEQDRLILEN